MSTTGGQPLKKQRLQEDPNSPAALERYAARVNAQFDAIDDYARGGPLPDCLLGLHEATTIFERSKATSLPDQAQQHIPANTAWLKELSRNLPVAVLGDIVRKLLDNPQTWQATQAAFTDCHTQHDFSLRDLAQEMVDKHAPEPSEDSYLCKKPHLCMLSESSSPLNSVLNIAQHWLTLQAYEAAFHLIIACVHKGADFEERGNDSDHWEEFDDRADHLLSEAIAHLDLDWDLDVQAVLEDMEGTQESGMKWDYGAVWVTALPTLRYKIASLK